MQAVGAIALSLIFWTVSVDSVDAQTVDFELVAPIGLNIEFVAYADENTELMRGQPVALPANDKLAIYKLRLAEGIPEGEAIVRWCVQTPSAVGPEVEAADAISPKLCTDAPLPVDDTYVFVASLESLDAIAQGAAETREDESVRLSELPNWTGAVTCVQAQLNALGYDVGDVDGMLGSKTKTGMDAFLESAKKNGVNILLPPLSTRTATFFCAALARFEPAKPAFDAYVGVGSGFEPFFSNLVLASKHTPLNSSPQILGTITLLRKGGGYAVRISGIDDDEAFFTPTVRRGLDQIERQTLLPKILDNVAITDFFDLELRRRELTYEADLKPAFETVDDVLLGTLALNNEQNRYDLFAEVDSGRLALYAVFFGPNPTESELFAVSILDRK